MKNIEETRARFKEISLLLNKRADSQANNTPAQSQIDLTPGRNPTIPETLGKRISIPILKLSEIIRRKYD